MVTVGHGRGPGPGPGVPPVEESGGLISANQALQMALGIESQEQERKQRAAEKDAVTTSRRCPKCGSPCPEYRKTCKGCGFEIGRAL